jgi:hypothetical protein
MAQQNASDTIPRVQASPLSGFPRPGLIPIPNMTVTSTVASTGSGVITLTAAQLLGGFIIIDTQDAQSATLPTAALLCEAIPGVTGTAQPTGDTALDAGWVLSPGDPGRPEQPAVPVAHIAIEHDEPAHAEAESSPSVDSPPEPSAPQRKPGRSKTRK